MALNVQLGNGVILAFPTPVVRHVLKEAGEINDKLRAAILKRAKKDAGVVRHNVEGWRSGDDLLSWPVPELEAVKGAINRAVAQLTQLTLGVSGKGLRGELSVSAWANVGREGAYIKPHMHPFATWSGVYFVSGDEPAEEHPDSGVLELIDPRPGVEALPMPGSPFGATLKVRPAPGLLVVHPGWLAHFVNPYRGKAERITIGFSVFVRGVTRAEEGEAPA